MGYIGNDNETSATAYDNANPNASEWANKPKGQLISSLAGGDQIDDYSAKHWAETAADNAALSDVNLIMDAKGDLIVATANNVATRLAVGANDTILTADSSEATGMKWVAPAVGYSYFSADLFSG